MRIVEQVWQICGFTVHHHQGPWCRNGQSYCYCMSPPGPLVQKWSVILLLYVTTRALGAEMVSHIVTVCHHQGPWCRNGQSYCYCMSPPGPLVQKWSVILLLYVTTRALGAEMVSHIVSVCHHQGPWCRNGQSYCYCMSPPGPLVQKWSVILLVYVTTRALGAEMVSHIVTVCHHQGPWCRNGQSYC